MSPPEQPRDQKRSVVRRVGVAIAGAVLGETLATWMRSHRLGGNLIVRCREGHLFTTIWIPAASVKSLRLGWWRFQRCPVGHHWTVVTPVLEADLSRTERRMARKHRDARVP